jgi:hypothetical protein
MIFGFDHLEYMSASCLWNAILLIVLIIMFLLLLLKLSGGVVTW